MFGLVKKWERKSFKRKYERLQQRLDELEKVQGEHKDKLGMLKRRAESHLAKHRQEKCEHTHKFFGREGEACMLLGEESDTPQPGYTFSFTETCTNCGKVLWKAIGLFSGDMDIEWQKRKLNYEKDIISKKFASVKEQIKALDKEKEKK